MPQSTKIFRVFVSSTFTDMKEERRLLQKEVFPRLEKYCEQKGAKFQAVDLRWGVTQESSLNQKTLEICLNEVKRCQRISPKPNFLILLGDKYGWQPLPSRIPSSEMSAIQEVSQNSELLREWYLEDLNAVPPEYILQPRGEKFERYKDWETIEKKLQESLRNSVNKLAFSQAQRVKYFTSATHQEILAGALHNNSELENPEDHVFCFHRHIAGLPEGETLKDIMDIRDGKQDIESRDKLNNLKEELGQKLGNHFIDYKANWDNGKLTIDNQETDFTDKIYDFFVGIISKQMDQAVSKDDIGHERLLHEEFMIQLVEHFKGRDKELVEIENYIRAADEQKPLALMGESGSGKSSVMAKAIHNILSEKENSLVIYRFIGASSGSTNLVSLLQSISGQIAREFGYKLEDLAEKGTEKELNEVYGISKLFKKCLTLSTEEKPVVIFMDALDQLAARKETASFHWLPNELTENTRMVVSTLNKQELDLDKLNKLELPRLPPLDAEGIIDNWLQHSKRILTAEQKKALLFNNKAEILPIYLKLAFEQARKWESYKTNFTLKQDVPGIINEFIDSLSHEHDKEFVEDVICLMLCGRYQGLAENEILEIFAFDDELWGNILAMSHEEHRQELIDMKEELGNSMKIPISLWSRLFLDLEPFLTERDVDGVPIIAFFHRQFNEVLKEKFQLFKTVEEIEPN